MVDKPNLLTEFPEITKEWDYEKNGSLKPQDVSKGSNKKVWWKCEKEHSWEATVADRTSGTGCPFCSGKKVLPGYNDLATTHPEIAKEWNYEKNGSLKPQDISKGSNKKVWWLCEQAHSYETTVTNRTSNGRGCPFCAGRQIQIGFNDLATTYPEIAKEWDYEKNIGLKPEMITPRNGRKVWWKCEKGHSWEAIVASRTDGRGCPFCAGKQIQIGFNDLATTNPEIAKEWDYKKNKGLKPEMFTHGSSRKVWWLCEKGHSYEATVANKTYGFGCPYCSMSTGEKIVDKVLNDLNLKYQTRVTFDRLRGIGGRKLSYDFGIYENDKLLFLIEYQGEQHYFAIDLFGGEKQLETQKFHDDLKREYAEKDLNVPLLEIPYEITEYDNIFNRIKNFYDHTFKS